MICTFTPAVAWDYKYYDWNNMVYVCRKGNEHNKGMAKSHYALPNIKILHTRNVTELTIYTRIY